MATLGIDPVVETVCPLRRDPGECVSEQSRPVATAHTDRTRVDPHVVPVSEDAAQITEVPAAVGAPHEGDRFSYAHRFRQRMEVRVRECAHE